MRAKRKRIVAQILTFILTFVTVFQSMSTDVMAASVSSGNAAKDAALLSTVSGNLVKAAVGDFVDSPDNITTWQMKASQNHGNAHPEASSGRAFFVVSDDNTKISNQNFNVKIKSLSTKADGRGGFVNKYIDENNYSFIGWDTGNWYLQWNGGWQPLNIDTNTIPEAGDEFTISGIWNTDSSTGEASFEVTVVNITKGIEDSDVITNEAFLALKDKEGKFGFRAGLYDSVATELLIELAYFQESGFYNGGYVSLFDELDGQVFKEYVKPVGNPQKWHILSADGNGNTEMDGSDAAFFAVSEEKAIMDEDFSVTFMPTLETNRMGFVNKYVSDSQWSYIGYNPANWYIQWAGTGVNWQDISTDEIPLPKPYDMVTIKGNWTDAGLVVTVINATQGWEKSVTVNNETFVGLKNTAGQFGFRAGSYGTPKVLTEYYVDSVTIGGQIWGGELTSLLADAKGATLKTVDKLPVKNQEGKKWFYLEGGSKNGGGHAYGDAAKAAPVTAIDKSRTMPVGGTLSMKFKVEGETPNFGIFYSYLDDDHWLYIGNDSSSGWYYQYKNGSTESYPKLSGLPSPVQGEEMEISISTSNEVLKVIVNGIEATTNNQDLYTLLTAINGTGRFGVKTNGKANPVSFADVQLAIGQENIDCMNDDWGFLVEREGQIFEEKYIALVDVSGNVVDASNNNAPLEGAVVRIGTNKATTNADGEFFMEQVQVGKYNATVSKKGYKAVTEPIEIKETDNVLQFAMESKSAVDLSQYFYLENNDMRVYVAQDFPRVLRYDVGEEIAMTGQEEELSQIRINNSLVTPAVTVNGFTQSDNATSILYTLDIQEGDLNLEMDVKISIDNKNLTWEVTRLDKAEGCAKIGTIEVPGLNLATIDEYSENTEFMGAKKSTNTTVSGDHRITFDDGFFGGDSAGYLYAFVSSNGYSAGLFSNSEAEGDRRIVRTNGADTISINSAPWYYELGDQGGQSYVTASEGYLVSELPVVKVCIADDMNGDNTVNWQDGAIAFRSIMNNPEGSELIKDLVAYRIVMNFASAAPNPFLETADNIKKVYLATDGLAQSVMLKGYGNEGHDSANSEYPDIAERQGGVKDFQNLIKIAHNYDTQIGIHVNAQETYPESASFNDNMIGVTTTGIGNGWGWLDQSHTIDKLWDLQSQARYKRFVQLYDRINGTNFYNKTWDPNNKLETAVGNSTGSFQVNGQEVDVYTAMNAIAQDAATRDDNMDFIYLDVWYQDSWETRKIAQEIHSLGWNFTTEFSDQGEYDSIWQHWATDAAYGGAGMKGFNSDVIRFIRNHQRDSQVLNYPEYGGTADNPLLGGFRLRGFEGWGGDNNFDNYIYYTFKDNMPTRFLQHYEVTNWVNYNEDESPVGNHEKEITLKNGNDTVVVTREEAQRSDDEIERTITLNGQEVLSCTTEHFYYLLPWTDIDGCEKLYHWNLDGGTSEWTLPESWNGTVHIYKITDQGRTDMVTETVSGGKLTLTGIEAAVPYVVVKADDAKADALKTVAEYGEYDYVVDPGFNSYSDKQTLKDSVWSGDLSSFVVERGSRGDQYVSVADVEKEVAASTKITGLVKGNNYVAEIYVDNQSNAKAYLEITNGTETLSNYTQKSIAQNYIQCDEQHTTSEKSYMQHILIPFQAQGTTATFTLRREAGQGITMWDDIRIVETQIENYKEDGTFVQDFEKVVQGLYPFVLGSAQGVTDPVTHLSEKHDPYTQYGWNGRVIDDVIEGSWSLKHHGQNAGIIYQTIPQNFRFEEGKSYRVTFDYQTGADQAYAMVVGNGTEYEAPDTFFATTEGNGTQTYSFKVVGSEGGQTWIGLYCNGTNEGESMGQKDFVLDNLVIEEDTNAVVITVEGGKKSLLKGESVQLTASNADGAVWTSDNEEVVKVDSATGLALAVGEGQAVITVTNKAGKTDSVTLKVSESIMESYTAADVLANTEESAGESGEAVNVNDNDLGTIWHSNWSVGFEVSETNPAIITLDLGEERDLTGFYFIQRTSGPNGLVLQYQWAVGNEYDAETYTITDSDLSNTIVTENPKNGVKETVEFPLCQARYIQVRVMEGHGGFASMSEFAGYKKLVVATAAELNHDKAELTVGDTLQLTAKATQGDLLADSNWKSSDETKAVVDEFGLVTALKEGTVTITFDGGNGAVASCDVTINAKPDEPDVPDEPDTPDVPDEPDTPDVPDEPDTPDVPDVPDTPDEPDTPDVPDEPDNSDSIEKQIEAAISKLDAVKNGTDEEKVSAVTEVQDMIKNQDHSQIKLGATNILAQMAVLESQMEELLGKKVTTETGFEIQFALFSVPAGKDAHLASNKVNIPSMNPVKGMKLGNAIAYDIKLQSEGKYLSLQAPVLLRVKLDNSLSSAQKIVVLHYADGADTPIKLEARVVNGFAEFMTDGFSTFVLASVDENSNNGSDNNDTPSGDDNNQNGSDEDNSSDKDNTKTPVQPNKKSPATYDNSPFNGMLDQILSGQDAAQNDNAQPAGNAAVAAATAGIGSVVKTPVVAIAILFAMLFIVTISLAHYKKSKKQ